MEDDIYYVPGKKALAIQEVENLTGHDIGTEQPVDPTVLAEEISRSAGSSTPPATFSSSNSTKINARSGQLEQVNIQNLTREAEEKLANNEEIDMTLYENTGYWIGGYRGPASDLAEIQRIINMYPEGFANFSNGQEIALNLSFDSDWNVYTDNGRYWWFPSNTNINLYSSLLFGTYPKYIWTIVWNNPRFDSWAFDATFNNRFNWSLNLGWAVRAGASDSVGIQAGTILGTEVGTIPGITPGTVVTIRDGGIHTGLTHIGDIPVGIIRTGAVEAVIIPTGPTGLIGQDNGLDSEAE